MLEAIIRIYRGITEKNNRLLFNAFGEFYTSLNDRLTAIESRLSALEPQPVPITRTSPVIASGGFSDDFNYVVNRDGPIDEFINHGWTRIKSLNNGDMRSRGYLYTTNLPNYVGKWLVMEAVSGGQTDYYLEKRMVYPLNLEINFTILIPDGPVTADKVIYPSPDGTYAVPAATFPWLIDIRPSNFGWLGTDYEVPADPNGPCYLMIESNENTGIRWHKNLNDSWFKMQHINPVPIRRNIPTDVRIKIDRSGVSNPGGCIDIDLREEGMEWVNALHAHHGEMVDGALFEWPLGNYDQISTIRIPTTQNSANIKYLDRIGFTEAV